MPVVLLINFTDPYKLNEMTQTTTSTPPTTTSTPPTTTSTPPTTTSTTTATTTTTTTTTATTTTTTIPAQQTPGNRNFTTKEEQDFGKDDSKITLITAVVVACVTYTCRVNFLPRLSQKVWKTYLIIGI